MMEKICLFRRKAITLGCIVLILVTQALAKLQNTAVEIVCAKNCTCTEERLSDVPMMKWQTIPMNRKFNNIREDNNVLDKDDEDFFLDQNPFVLAAFCIQQDDVININHKEFAPAAEALTLLYGPDTYNKTIVHELDEFRELIALDIQGYDFKASSPHRDSELKLDSNALRELHYLRYLNIENIRLFPCSNAIHQDYDANLSNRSTTPPPLHNITYLLSSEVEILPYEEYKKQKSLTSTFTHLIELQFLRLHHCYIDSIAGDMFEGLQNLRVLSLQGNDIIEIPDYAFFAISQLKTLILSHNKISRIHSKSLAGLFHLENLDLSHNQLKTLSDTTLPTLPELYSLNLLGNPLESLAGRTFEPLNSTRVLWVGSQINLLVQDGTFTSLNQLEKLILLGIDTNILHKDMLRGLSNLKYFRVLGNVESLVFDTFTSSVLLEDLILRYCSLKSVSVDAFYGLTQLKKLDLSRNKLQTLQPGIFDQLLSLKELNLARNQFTTLPKLVLSNLRHVDMIRLEANPWNCSCDMSEWKSLNLDKKKVVRMIEQPCTHQYDKVPCSMARTEIYVHDPRVTPRCATPDEYGGWSVLRAVHANVECFD